MAGDWLKFEANTPEKPEVLAITVELGFDDPDLTVGKLLKVWRWFDQHTLDGNAINVTSVLLDRLIGVTGITKAMANVGWLIVTDTGISLPNFDRHNGKTAKDRALTAKRVASHKASKAGNGESVTSALPREEKRREDINTNTLVHSQAVDVCPHQKIIDLYHEKLPSLTRVKVWSQKRQAQLQARWREEQKRQNLDYWARLFEYISESDFLTGKSGSFRADLEWITNSTNFTKIIEGKYENRIAA